MFVPLAELVQVQKMDPDYPIFHEEHLPVVYVVADKAGKLDSPLYRMFGINAKTSDMQLSEGGALESC